MRPHQYPTGTLSFLPQLLWFECPFFQRSDTFCLRLFYCRDKWPFPLECCGKVLVSVLFIYFELPEPVVRWTPICDIIPHAFHFPLLGCEAAFVDFVIDFSEELSWGELVISFSGPSNGALGLRHGKRLVLLERQLNLGCW